MKRIKTTDERLRNWIEILPLDIITMRAQYLGCDDVDAIVDLTCNAFQWDPTVTTARVLAMVLAMQGGMR